MSPRRRVSIVAFCTFFSAGFTAFRARADAGGAFAESSRSASLANAVTARPGDATTLLTNPAGLPDAKEATVAFGGHGDALSLSWQANGDPNVHDLGRAFGGFSFAAATPLPGPAWAHRIAVGVALDVPAAYLLDIHVPDRLDEPTSPFYDGPPDRIAGALAVGYEMFRRISIGAGFAISPSLALPTYVTYVAGRGPGVNDNVEVRIDSSLDLSVAPFFGLRARPFDWLSLALVYRDTQASHAQGTQTTIAGGIVASGPQNAIDFFEMWDPASVVVGAAFTPNDRITLSLDVAWHKWSDFRNAFDQQLAPPYQFNDTVSVASGVEVALARGKVLVRGGLGVDPSPLPAQTGVTNYLGANTFVAALGAGVDFRKLAHLPMMIDAHVRVRASAEQTVTKNPNALPDSDPTTPGTQIDEIAYSGFRSRATLFQAGLTTTFFLGGAK
jgi:hypothetical protein